MTKQKLNIIKNSFDRSIEILTFLLILGSVILIGIYYNELPEKLPIYFNDPSTDKNGFGQKSLLWTMPIISGLIGFGIYKLNQNPWFFNYQTKINKGNTEHNYKITSQMFRVLGLVIGFMCLSIISSSVLNGLGNTTNFKNYIYPFFPLLLIVIPILYLIKILAKKIKLNNKL